MPSDLVVEVVASVSEVVVLLSEVVCLCPQVVTHWLDWRVVGKTPKSHLSVLHNHDYFIIQEKLYCYI